MNLHSLFLALILTCCTSCSMEQPGDAWQALPEMKPADYFDESLQLKLITAITNGNLNEMTDLIKNGANVNSIGRNGMQPLFWAIAKNRLAEFEVLLRNGASPNSLAKPLSQSDKSLSAMELAAVSKNPKYMLLLLEHGGNANQTVCYANRTIIYEAILNERIDNVKLLIEHGASILHADIAGESPLMTAASVNAYDIVLLLLRNGADPTQKNKWGYDLAWRVKKYGTGAIPFDSPQIDYYNRVLIELKNRGVLKL